MTQIIFKILNIKSWKAGLLVLMAGFPVAFVHIISLQKSGKADDIGLWYRIYCAVAYTAPYAIGAFVIHLLARHLWSNSYAKDD